MSDIAISGKSIVQWSMDFAISAVRLLFALLLLGVSGTVWPQDLFDDPDDGSAAVAGGQAVEVIRTTAPPPRTLDDITQALQRYKSGGKKTERNLNSANQPAPDTTDRQMLYDFYINRGRAAQRIGLLSQTIEDYRLAGEYAPTEAYRRQVMSLYGRAQRNGGNYLTAISVYENEVEKRKRANAIAGICALTVLRAEIGDVATAKRHLAGCDKSVKAHLSRSGNAELSRHEKAAGLERARKSIAIAEGRLADAEASARTALAEIVLDSPFATQRRQLGIDGSASSGAQNRTDNYELQLAEVLMLRGKLIESEIAARNVVRSYLARMGLYRLETGRAMMVLSRIIFEQGRFREAAALAVAAIDSFEQSGAVPESLPLVEARKTYGAALTAQQRWGEALAEFEKMQAGLARDPLLAQLYGTGDINWAWTLIKIGQADAAISMLAPIISRTQQRLGERAYQTAELRGFYAVALVEKKDRQRAREEFAKAVPILLEQARSDDASESGGIARTLRRIQILEAYIELLAELASASGGAAQDAVAESFRLADAARGSGVQRALVASAARAQMSDAQLVKLAREEQDAGQRIGLLTDLLSRLLAASPGQQLPKIIGELRQEVENLRARRVTLRQEIHKRFPTYGSLVDPEPASLSQAQAALRPGEALISIYVGDATTYVWAVPHRGVPQLAVVRLGEREIAAAVAHLRRAVDSGGLDIDRMPRFDIAAAHKLYQDVLRPVEPAWKSASTLVIVPHRALGQLPFSVLVSDVSAVTPATFPFSEYAGVPWLVRRASIAQLPSVNTLVILRRMGPGRADRQPFIGFGDPLFSKQQAASVSAPGMNRGLALRAAPLSREAADFAQLSQLARLPDTAEELRDIALSLNADLRASVFVGVAANEQNVKTVDLSRHKVVAFATHGLVPGDLNGLDQPALAFTAPDVADVQGDGLLMLDEVLTLKLDADWVVLSACNTASSSGTGSEAVSGLGRAFFFAGARALLVSNWPVETTSARAITTELFRRQASDPSLSRANALRQSMLSLIDGPGYVDPTTGRPLFSYAHPLFWAPFSLIGDGGTR